MLKLMQAPAQVRTVSEAAELFFEGLTWSHADLAAHINRPVRVRVDVAQGLLHLVVLGLDGSHICNARHTNSNHPLKGAFL